jgi:hypothetical protein
MAFVASTGRIPENGVLSGEPPEETAHGSQLSGCDE